MGILCSVSRLALRVPIAALVCSVALAQDLESGIDSRRVYVPDLRGADIPATAQKGNFVVAPIPFSNPTFDTGLILGAAYFYPQTAEQAEAQPASVTGLGLVYSQNGSQGVVLGHSGYLNEDRWRISGTYGKLDLKLPLLALDPDAELLNLDWLLNVTLWSSEVFRQVGKNWYAGMSFLDVQTDQNFQATVLSEKFNLTDSFRSRGLGPDVTYDTRDMPTNAYDGRYFRLSALFYRDSFGSDVEYDAYSLELRSYHSLADTLVLAWEIGACGRSDGAPLWDACSNHLRGFPSTDYLGTSSISAQVEARWRFARRWGLVGFAGSGQVRDSLSDVRENDWVPSVGAGLRFMIQQEKRINLRLDYARSTESRAVTFFVGEAF